MKICPHCNTLLELEFFPIDRSRKDGRYVYCRTCSVDLQMEYRANNPERHREAVRRYVEKNKQRNAQREASEVSESFGK